MYWAVILGLLAIIAIFGVKIVKRAVKKWIPKDLDKFFRSIDRLSSEKIFKVKFLHKDMYFVQDPDLIHKVLTSEVCMEKPRMIYKFFGLNDGLLCCGYKQWRRDRKNFSSSFNNVMVSCFVPIFCRIADRMICKIKMNDYSQKEVDMIHFTERCTISMILATSFNIFPEDIASPDEEIGRVAEAVKITSFMLSERFKKFVMFFDTVFKRTEQYRQQNEIRDSLYDLFHKILDEKTKNGNNNEEQQPSFFQNIFYNKVMTFKNEMTEDQIKDSIFTVIGAGFETTGTASAHCILFLAMHPEIQEKVHQEIMSVFPSDDIEITYDTLSELSYLENVMKESLRLGPTVHSIAREAMDNFEISPGKVIKRGSIFCINIYGLHHRKDLWGEDAELFNPDRFLPEYFDGKQQYFIPFSIGRRNCLGYRYAYTSFKVMMVKLLRNFKFTTNLKLNEIKFNRQIALKLMGKHLVMIEKRH
ncbi:unnamed protein product [Chironomus riparius]|uniref:Cytochrome P450 n=1 Tax=Chironomus riparius TaxID=315576 RepID=A0A9N9S0T3_9DIPT|nr:unnamed protein product [Chironomus riparius]